MGISQTDSKTGRFIKLDINESQLVQLYNTGMSESDIAKKTGHKQQTVSTRLRKLGLPSKRAKLQPMVEKDDHLLCERCAIYKAKDSFIYTKGGRLRFRFCRSCKYKSSTKSIYKSYVSYIRSRIRHIRYQAKNNGTPFDIDVKYCVNLWDKQNGKCFYTDEPLEIENTNKTRHNHNSASLDKIVPQLGYVEGNVVWCIQRINVMKNDATLDEMKEWMPAWHRRIQIFLNSS